MRQELYDVFLSYRHKPLDGVITQQTFNILESYKLPKTLQARGLHGVRSKVQGGGRDADRLIAEQLLCAFRIICPEIRGDGLDGLHLLHHRHVRHDVLHDLLLDKEGRKGVDGFPGSDHGDDGLAPPEFGKISEPFCHGSGAAGGRGAEHE